MKLDNLNMTIQRQVLELIISEDINMLFFYVTGLVVICKFIITNTK